MNAGSTSWSTSWKNPTSWQIRRSSWGSSAASDTTGISWNAIAERYSQDTRVQNWTPSTQSRPGVTRRPVLSSRVPISRTQGRPHEQVAGAAGAGDGVGGQEHRSGGVRAVLVGREDEAFRMDESGEVRAIRLAVGARPEQEVTGGREVADRGERERRLGGLRCRHP